MDRLLKPVHLRIWRDPERRVQKLLRFSETKGASHCSDRTAIAAQAHCAGEECRSEREADPQTGTAQKFSEVEVSQHHDAALHARIPCAATDA